MNDDDIADSLCLVYHQQRFQQYEKWWWALFIWGFEVSLTNAYMMRRYCELKCVHVPYSHHDFKEKYKLAYLDPKKHWPHRKSPPLLSLMSAKTPRRNIKQQGCWAPRFYKTALCQDDGWIKKQLDNALNHISTIPAGKKGKANSQLCWWDSREKTDQNAIPPVGRQHAMLRKEYRVNICCWEIFHSEPNINENISDILLFI